MLNLILLLVILSWIIYRRKKGKKLFPKEFFEDQFSRRPLKDDPPWGILVLLCVGMFFIVSYTVIPIVIDSYDDVSTAIANCMARIEATELAIGEVNGQIEEISMNLELSSEEKESSVQLLMSRKSELENNLARYNEELTKLPLGITPGRIKAYKFLLYPFCQ